MDTLKQVSEALKALATALESVQAFESRLEDLYSRQEDSVSQDDLTSEVESVLDGRDYLDAYEVEDKISDAISIAVDDLDIADEAKNAVRSLNFTVKID